MIPKISDSEIHEALKNGQKERALKALMALYQERLYFHIRRMVVSHDDTDDLLQETFIKAWKNLEKFRGDSGFFTWLYRIATNEVITFLNKKKRKPTLHLSDHENLIPENNGYYTSADGVKALKLLREALDRLPDKQKLVFNMKYYDEMKYEEISKITGTSVGALKASYHHSVKKIEEYLKNH